MKVIRRPGQPAGGWRPVLPLAAVLLATLGLLLEVIGASAHVGVLPAEVQPGVSQTFTVRVPNEKDEATIRVRVDIPSGLVVSRFQPLPGWTREVQRDAQGLISGVTWFGGRIAPDEYQDFTFVARTPRDPVKLTFKAYQTYQGGETVEWVEGQQGNLPAAVVEVKAGASVAGALPATDAHGQAVAATPAGAATPARQSSASAGGAAADGTAMSGGSGAGGSDLPLLIAIGAVALAVLSLAVAGVALARGATGRGPEAGGASRTPGSPPVHSSRAG
jgi:uncharacterized protein YcnI